MKKIFLTNLLLLFTLVSFAAKDEVTITIQYTKVCGDKVVVEVGDKREVVKMENDLLGKVTFPNLSSGYAILKSGSYQRTIYLESGKDLKVTITPSIASWYKTYKYEGQNAAINDYLLMKDSIAMSTQEDYKLNPEAYIELMKSLTEKNIKWMESFGLDKKFEKVEKIRLKYLVHTVAPGYMTQHFWENPQKITGVEQYYDIPDMTNYLETLVIDDPSYWNIAECRKVFMDVISVITRDEAISTQFYDCVVNRCKYVKENFKSELLREALVHRFAMIYTVRSEGEELKEIQPYYDEMVKNPEYISELAQQKKAFSHLRKGADFGGGNYVDIDGKTVNFDDLKGKYVYIDVWATWCGPCCQEIEPLKELEGIMHGKNIHFVSISVDASREAWIKKVRAENMTGIQLYGGPSAKIMKDYSIAGIPRFILLDKEGKMINGNMTRPSDPATLKTLKELKEID